MLVFAIMMGIGGVYAVCKSIEMKAAAESAKRRDEQSYEHLKVLHDIYEKELIMNKEELEKKMASNAEDEEPKKDEEKTES